MKKIKGRYVATVIITMDVDESNYDLLPFKEIKKRWNNLGIEVRNVLENYIIGKEDGSIEVVDQYKEVCKLED